MFSPTPSSNTNWKAVTSLVLGIISIVLFCVGGAGILTGIVGVIFGALALKEIVVTGQAGKEVALFGIVLNSVPIFLLLFSVLFILVVWLISAIATIISSR
jgi:hypothetical protein